MRPTAFVLFVLIATPTLGADFTTYSDPDLHAMQRACIRHIAPPTCVKNRCVMTGSPSYTEGYENCSSVDAESARRAQPNNAADDAKRAADAEQKRQHGETLLNGVTHK